MRCSSPAPRTAHPSTEFNWPGLRCTPTRRYRYVLFEYFLRYFYSSKMLVVRVHPGGDFNHVMSEQRQHKMWHRCRLYPPALKAYPGNAPRSQDRFLLCGTLVLLSLPIHPIAAKFLWLARSFIPGAHCTIVDQSRGDIGALIRRT